MPEMDGSPAMLFCTPPPICRPTISVPFVRSDSASKAAATAGSTPDATSPPITTHAVNDARFPMPPRSPVLEPRQHTMPSARPGGGSGSASPRTPILPARPQPAREGDAEPPIGGQRHPLAEDLETARLHGAQEGEVGAPHDLGCEEAARVGRRQRRPGALVISV